MRSHSYLFILVATCLGALPTGCTEVQEPVATYTVPKDEVIQIPVETPGGAAHSQSTAAKTEGRMLAALILHDDVAWSFKALDAPEKFPADAAANFEQLIKSLKFDDPQKPTWDLGDSWQERPGSGMRTANLMLGELEFSVIKLPAQSVLENVNRWRGQLSLPPIGQADLASSVSTVQTQDGHEATLLDLTGMQSGGGMGGPMARRQPPPSAPRTSAKPFTDRPPEDWKVTRPGMMQLAVYSLESNGQTAKVSISRAGGDILANINRWRGQVRLAPLTELSEAHVQDVQVSGMPGIFVEIHGESGQSIVVAMLPADRPTWFFKLQGDTRLVQEQTASFQDYLSTVQLE